jgi:hypothetical protein
MSAIMSAIVAKTPIALLIMTSRRSDTMVASRDSAVEPDRAAFGRET